MKETNKARIDKIKEYRALHKIPEFANSEEYHAWMETPDGKEYATALENIRDQVKQRGGKRAGSGRKKIYQEGVTIHKRVSKETLVLLKEYSKKCNISENQALDMLVQEGYKHIQEA